MASKFMLKSHCKVCRKLLLVDKNKILELPCSTVGVDKRQRDLFVCVRVSSQVSTKSGESFHKLLQHTRASPLKHNGCRFTYSHKPQENIGCADHSEVLVAGMIAFYVATRIHFFMILNSAWEEV